jgi:hypothetical protein
MNMTRRTSLVFAWMCTVTVAFPHVWNLLVSSTLPLPGLKGLVNPSIGIPVLFFAATGSVVLTVNRFYKIWPLLFWGGALSAVGFTLMWGVANSGGLMLTLLGGALAVQGRDLLSAHERRFNSSLDTGATRGSTER